MNSPLNQPNSLNGDPISALTLPAQGVVIPSVKAKDQATITNLHQQWESNHKVILDLLTSGKIGTLDRLMLCSVGPSSLENRSKPAAGKFTVVRVHDSTRSEQALINLYKMALQVSLCATQDPETSNPPTSRHAILVFEAPTNNHGYQPLAPLHTRTWMPIAYHKDSIREHLTPSGAALANAYACAWKGTLELTKEAFGACYRGATGLQIKYPSSIENNWEARIRWEILLRLRAQEVAFECIKLLGIEDTGGRAPTKAA